MRAAYVENLRKGCGEEKWIWYCPHRKGHHCLTASEESDFHSTSKAGITNLSINFRWAWVGLLKIHTTTHCHSRWGGWASTQLLLYVPYLLLPYLLLRYFYVRQMLSRLCSLRAVQTLALQREIYDLDPGGPMQSPVCFQSFLCPVFHLQCPLLFLAQIWHGLRARVIWHPLAALADPLALHSQWAWASFHRRKHKRAMTSSRWQPKP